MITNDDLEGVLGQKGIEDYFSFVKSTTFKGFDEPQRLHEFHWKKFAADNPDLTLAGLINRHLESADVEFMGIDAKALSGGGVVIWPVVPRKIVTAIHRGQVEILKLLRLLGWTTRLVLADCSKSGTVDRSIVSEFEERLITYGRAEQIVIGRHPYMSSMYDPTNNDYPTLQELFRQVVMDWSVSDLIRINGKKYTDSIKEIINQTSTLGYLKPALTVAAVVMVENTASNKCIVLAGQDERTQWDTSTRLRALRAKLGGVLNPLLKEDSEHQERQQDEYPIWKSKHDMQARMNGTNLAAWLFKLFALIPAFPANGVVIGDKEFRVGSWSNEETNPAELNLRLLVEYVWPRLNPNR